MKIVKRLQLKFVIFAAVKNCCILHGCVFIMLRVSIFLFWPEVNSVDPDLAPHNVVSDEGLHCLYGIFIISCRGRGSLIGSEAVYILAAGRP